MLFSRISKKISETNGIYSLMEDLSSALTSDKENFVFLGGGNPASIESAEKIFAEALGKVTSDSRALNRLLGEYAGPIGNSDLRILTASYLSNHLGYPLKSENISFFNGSQNAYSYLLNAFSGTMIDGSFKHILLPIVPEYIGYLDQTWEENVFSAGTPNVELVSDYRFRYTIDHKNLDFETAGCIAFSRPTNPTGNVLPIAEIDWLYEKARALDIPILVDLAYGNPFPNLIGDAPGVKWKPGMVFSLSFSKVGLPGVRFGIIIADPRVTDLLSRFGAIGNLAVGNLGPELARIFWQENTLTELSNNILRPFYEQRCESALIVIDEVFQASKIKYSIHVPDGAFFLWIYFPDLKITNRELYELCKKARLFIVSGHYFFPELNADFSHSKKCIRLTYCRDIEELARGAKIIAEIVTRNCA